MNESFSTDHEMDELLIRSLQGRTTPEEEARLRAWRREDAEHEHTYRRLRELWYLVGAANPVQAREDIPSSVGELMARVEDADFSRPEGETADEGRIMTPRDSDATDMRSSVGEKGRAEKGWVRSGLKLALAASVAALAFGLGMAMDLDSEAGALVGGEVVTQAGEAATLSLADGSSVRLGSESRLRLAQDDAVIVAHLEGRAFFGIEGDGSRQFRVETHRGDVTVLGTRFEVRSENGEFRVVVVEGTVQMTAGGVEVKLGEGDVGRRMDGEPLTTERADDLQELLGWMTGILSFYGTPLHEAAREIERRYGVEVVLADEELTDLTVTATFMDESVDNVVRVLCELLGAQCSVQGDRIRLGH